ncbi:2895_t:CDS:2, partial [Racocetra fulgida]
MTKKLVIKKQSADVDNNEKIENDEKTIQIPMQPIRIFIYYHRNYAVNATKNDTVLELKKKIRSMLDINIKKISLSFSRGSFDYFVLTNDYLDPRFDNDFTYQRDGPTLTRGNEPYKPPYGWKRIAISIKKYGDNTWIGTDKNSWPVSFHGTRKDAAENIAKDGFDLSKGKRFKYGKGIYSTPDVREAECYATSFSYQNCNYKVIFQNRVNPNDLKKANNDTYWITANDKNIRPY